MTANKLHGAALIEALTAVDFPEVDALAVTLIGEAAGEAIEGRIAVACCVRNRVRADLGNDGRPDWWGEGYRGVVWARAQFSCWWPYQGFENHARIAALALELAAGRVPAASAAMVDECRAIAEAVILGRFGDRVGGCRHYHAKNARPPWARGVAPAVVVGKHVFYRGIK
jgi:N-acetylmuramoyl-L-alanine amidase